VKLLRELDYRNQQLDKLLGRTGGARTLSPYAPPASTALPEPGAPLGTTANEVSATLGLDTYEDYLTKTLGKTYTSNSRLQQDAVREYIKDRRKGGN
jgi:hypothetical protein